jgi:hypothetical protein
MDSKENKAEGKRYKVLVSRAATQVTGETGRRRAGIHVPADGGYTGKLSAEQVQAIKEDSYLILTNEDGTAVEDASAADGDAKTEEPKRKRELGKTAQKASDDAPSDGA